MLTAILLSYQKESHTDDNTKFGQITDLPGLEKSKFVLKKSLKNQKTKETSDRQEKFSVIVFIYTMKNLIQNSHWIISIKWAHFKFIG